MDKRIFVWQNFLGGVLSCPIYHLMTPLIYLVTH